MGESRNAESGQIKNRKQKTESRDLFQFQKFLFSAFCFQLLVLVRLIMVVKMAINSEDSFSNGWAP